MGIRVVTVISGIPDLNEASPRGMNSPVPFLRMENFSTPSMVQGSTFLTTAWICASPSESFFRALMTTEST